MLVKLLPDQVAGTVGVMGKDIVSLELKIQEERPLYTIKAMKPVKLFGIISITQRIEGEIDAESGEIISMKKPWWSFLAFG